MLSPPKESAFAPHRVERKALLRKILKKLLTRRLVHRIEGRQESFLGSGLCVVRTSSAMVARERKANRRQFGLFSVIRWCDPVDTS
jgi:hypothetical protein